MNSVDRLSDRSCTVLIVDDDPVFLAMMEAVLLARGVTRVLTATDGDAADRILSECACAIDLITLDLNMPNRDGVGFIRLASQHHFSGRMILISGEHRAVVQSAARLAGMLGMECIAALAKPVDYERVADLALDTASARMPNARMDGLNIEEVNAGLRNSRLFATYQPRIELATGAVAGAEVLARMRDACGELIDAGRMINLAEENGRLTDITWRIIEIVCEESPALFEALGDSFKLSFNISISTLANPRFPEQLSEMIRLSGMSTERFVLELTESRIPTEPARALELLTRLRIQGFGLAVDDFGTGYSNIERLRMFPFTELKIDKSFMLNAPHDSFARACIETGVALARELSLRTVVEGVETAGALELARRLAIDEAQGFLFARPMTCDAFLAYAAGHRSARAVGDDPVAGRSGEPSAKLAG